MPPLGAEHLQESSGNTGVRSEGGAQSGALSSKTDPRAAEATDQADPLAKLAAALLTLSPADRERLAAMLTGQPAEGEGDHRADRRGTE